MLGAIIHTLGLVSCGATAGIWYVLVRRSGLPFSWFAKRFFLLTQSLEQHVQAPSRDEILALLASRKKTHERASRNDVQKDVSRVADYALAQGAVGMAEHSLIALRSLRLSLEQIGNPPGAKLAHEKQAAV